MKINKLLNVGFVFSIGAILKPLPQNQEPLKPHCDSTLPPSPLTLDHLTAMRMRHHRLGLSPEPALADWLGLMAGDHLASVRDIATRIALTLQEVCKLFLIILFLIVIFWLEYNILDISDSRSNILEDSWLY